MLLLTVFKTISIRIAGSVFSTKNAALQYQDHMLISMFTSSTLIVPLLVVNAFSGSKVFLVSSLIILGGVSLVRLVRSLGISFQVTGYSPFHFLLYFCTLEILPLAILGK